MAQTIDIYDDNFSEDSFIAEEEIVSEGKSKEEKFNIIKGKKSFKRLLNILYN